MSDPQAAADTLASGLGRTEITTLLADAEPQRRTALAASLNLSGGIALTMAGSALGNGSVLWLAVAGIVAAMFWRLCNRLWRDLAIAAVAPAIGARWGQSDFVSGWGAVEIEQWIGDLFSADGTRFTAWHSHGRYRDTDYRLTETTTWLRRRNDHPREIVHALQVEVAVPVSFTGSVELLPKSGLMGKVDDLLRQWTGEAERRQDVDDAFDAVFDTMVSPATPVDKLLTPNFRRAMLALAARHKGVYLTARFEHGWFSLRLPIPHLAFSSAGLFKPMPSMVEDADALWWDLTVPHRLIDGLRGDHEGPLR